jgi:hypothetical protein
MEAIAYRDRTMRCNNLLGLGEAYDFMRVGLRLLMLITCATFSVYVLTTMSLYLHKL